MSNFINIKIPVIAIVLLIGFQPLLALAAPVISAVQITGGSGKTTQDFIELKNPDSQPYNLKNHFLVKRTAHGKTNSLIYKWDTDAWLKPATYFLWANQEWPGTGVVPNAINTQTISSDNGVAFLSGDYLVGTEIQSLSWGQTDNGWSVVIPTNPGANQSLVLQSDGKYLIQPSQPHSGEIIYGPLPVEVPIEQPLKQDTEPVSPPSADPLPVDLLPEFAKLEIVEILPNPIGADSGQESLEIYNGSDKLLTLDNLYITTEDSTNNFQLSGNIQPGQYVNIIFPSSSNFVLVNSGERLVKLYNSNSQLIDSAAYIGPTPEGKSYQKISNQWYWQNPSPNTVNILEQQDLVNIVEQPAIDNNQTAVSQAINSTDFLNNQNVQSEQWTAEDKLVISELYPNPASGSDEFVELQNQGSTVLNLALLKIKIGTKQIALPEILLQPKQFALLSNDELPIRLRNGGQDVSLVDPAGQIIDKLSYPSAKKGQSYSLVQGDEYVWTEVVTPGQANTISNSNSHIDITSSSDTLNLDSESTANSQQTLNSQSNQAKLITTINALSKSIKSIDSRVKKAETKLTKSSATSSKTAVAKSIKSTSVANSTKTKTQSTIDNAQSVKKNKTPETPFLLLAFGGFLVGGAVVYKIVKKKEGDSESGIDPIPLS